MTSGVPNITGQIGGLVGLGVTAVAAKTVIDKTSDLMTVDKYKKKYKKAKTANVNYATSKADSIISKIIR